jgi:acetyl esterase/lipase
MGAAMAGILLVGGYAGLAQAQAPQDGSVRISGLSVPPSNLLSPEARDYIRHLVVDRPFAGGPRADEDIAGYRAHQDAIMQVFLAPMRKRYPVVVKDARIGGVRVQVVTPLGGIAAVNRHRILLNVHGGGFLSGAGTASLVESIPIAAVMGVRVISIDYRMSPEAKFPAADEDVTAVYRDILKTHRPRQIGLYGCSAGGVLTGQSIAWFRARKLPRPGAAGVLCAPLGAFVEGDEAYLAGPLNGQPVPPDGHPASLPFSYMSNARADDPLAYPLSSRETLAAFPPTLLVTGGRSMEASAVFNTHNALVRAGVDAQLHVWDGLPHAFFYNSDLPESREVYDVIAGFFDKHLER